jgi:hypothetical protein
LRNILSLGFASDQSAMLQNMAKGSIQGSRKRTAKERN